MEIIDGVRQAQLDVQALGGQVVSSQGTRRDQDVNFDVEVTTMDATNAQSGLGVFVGAVAAGTKGASASESASAARIKFTVPVTLPMHSSTLKRQTEE